MLTSYRAVVLLFAIIVLGRPNYAAVADRIPAKSSFVRSVPLKTLPRPEAIPVNDAGPADAAMPVEYATVFLRPAPGLELFLAEQQNPSSPDYHRWLTPEQFGERFGVSANDLAQLTAWLEAEGLTVKDIARGRLWITFSGSAVQMSRAFHTEIRRYRVNGVNHFANASALSVPAAFESVIAAVDGLHDFTPEPFYRMLPESAGPRLTSGNSHYLAPDDIATIYDIAPLYATGIDGVGQKVAVIGQTDVDLADIRAFRTRFGLAVNEPQILLYGPDPGTSAIDLGEADLDLEWTGAVARNAFIIYVNSRNVFLSAQYAVDQNLAPVMTLSYGSCELTANDTLQSVARQASAQGITWMVSSGDSGAATCDVHSPIPQASKGPTVSYPASIPEVTAVGGTQFDDSTGPWWAASNRANFASALSYIPEKVWNQSLDNNRLEGGGGGVSSLFPKPAWQTGPGVPADGQRDIPDISFTAATHDPYEIYSAGAVRLVGGTSASSPVFAGIVALLNHSLARVNPASAVGVGNINPALYRLAQSTTDVFHDTTVGDNKVPCLQSSPGCVNGLVGFSATPGYDAATGLGSLDVANFIKEWNLGTASTTSLAASPASYAITDKVTLTAAVSGSGAVPTGTVTFVSNDISLGTVALSPGKDAASASLTVDGTVLAGGNGVAGALYSGDAAFTASTGSATLSLKAPSTGSFLIPSVTPNPVHQVGSSWPYTIQLTEKAGVATRVTAFTVNNVNNLSAISNPNIIANGSFTTSLAGSNLSVPLNRVFHFEGMDADGTTWKRDLTVPFLGPEGTHVNPSISLFVTPSVAQQNTNADPSCQWSQQVTVQENSGYEVNLSSLLAGSTSFTGTLSRIFGTTRLSPLGLLTGAVCFGAGTAPQTKNYSVIGVSENGSLLTATAPSSLAAPAASPANLSVSSTSISLDSGNTSGKLDVAFDTGTPSWTATILPAFQKWLTLSASSGKGSASLTLTASAAGLSNGVYNAILSISSMDAAPQAIQVPVVFVVGASATTIISGVGNAASGDRQFAPGQLAAVYGTGLAPGTVVASIQPLPLTLSGVSATVNGVSAPLWFISPGQINLQIPYETSAGPAVLGINNNGQVSAFNLQISPTAPGFFALDGNLVPFSSAAPGQTIFGFITGDGDVTPTLATGATPAAGTSLARLPVSRLPLTVMVGGEPATVVFNGIVNGLIGVTQVNFTVPADLKPGVQPVVVSVGGVPGTPVNLTITGN